MTKTLELSITQTFKEIIEDHGFKDTGDSVKFEKKTETKSFSIKAQESFPGVLTVRIRTTNKTTGSKSETIFHKVDSASTISDIADSLAS